MGDDEASDAAQLRIADAIRNLRTQQGFANQETFAAAVRKSRSAIASAETGKATVSLVQDIAATYPEFEPEATAFIESQSGKKTRKGSTADGLEEMFFRRSNVVADLKGEWHALWEAPVDGQKILNAEVLQFDSAPRNRIRIRNIQISPDNPDGGYLWTGDCRMYDNQFILGTYIATEPSVRSQGVLQLALRSSGREIEGQWAGASFDSDFSQGLVVMTRRPDELQKAMTRLRKKLEMR